MGTIRNIRLFMMDVITCGAGRISGIVKITLVAGRASPSPPIGPALGAKGLNIASFCKAYNDLTRSKEGTVVPAIIELFDDNSFSLQLKIAAATVLLRNVSGHETSSVKVNQECVSSVTLDDITQVTT